MKDFTTGRGGADFLVATPVFTSIVTGECIIGTAAAVLGTAAAGLILLRASAANAGTVYIGGSGVTIPNGTADTTTGMQLVSTDWSPALPLDNLSRLWGIASADAQAVFYVALS